MINRVFLPRNVQVVVASFGGVGTTFLARFISEFKRTNCPKDLDGLKHSPLPPLSRDKSVRFVYVYGNPIDAAISLFNRKYHHNQSQKLQRYQKTRMAIPAGMTLEEYAAQGEDRFLFRRHFDNWYNTYLCHPTLFLRYESVFENKHKLVEFLGLPDDAVDSFPEKQERTSTLDSLPPGTVNGLNEMYGEFKEYLDSVGDAEERIPANDMAQVAGLSDQQYRRAIAAQFAPKNILESIWRTRLRGVYKELTQCKPT